MSISENIFTLAFVVLCSTIISCGSSTTTSVSSDDDGAGNADPGGNATVENVASTLNGGMSSSTFSGNETFTNDGDTSSTNFWIGGADGDEVKIAFDQSYSVSEIVVYTNNTGFSVSGGVITSGIRVQLSSDDVNYEDVAAAFGLAAPISCSTLLLGSGKITCVLGSGVDAQYIKVLVTSDFAVSEIYEIEVSGI